MFLRVLFCESSDEPGQVEEQFQREAEAAGCGGLIDHSAAARGDLRAALARLPTLGAPEPALYRGWMLSAVRYAELYAALQARGYALLTSPEAYRLCHHLPESYPLLAEVTPRSVWLDLAGGLDLPRVLSQLQTFGSAPVILKDYVKSEKHDWEGACFIPCAADADAVARVLAGFRSWRGSDLEGGLVFREFVTLRSLGSHGQSGMPLTREFRLFVARGQILTWFPYWGQGDYTGEEPPLAWAQEVASAIESPLFSLDLAQREDGSWLVIELGDGQVAGLPEHVDPGPFYERLRALLD